MGVEHLGFVDKQDYKVMNHKGVWEVYDDQGDLLSIVDLPCQNLRIFPQYICFFQFPHILYNFEVL